VHCICSDLHGNAANILVEMLPAVICFVSVLCTTSLASFGMDAAAAMKETTSAQEDILRVVVGEDGSSNAKHDVCLMFHELFAAVAVLVSIVYYAVVKLTLVAMGAVIMVPPDPHPLYGSGSDSGSSSVEDEDEEDARSHSTFSGVSSSSSSKSEDDEIVYQCAPPTSSTSEAAQQQEEGTELAMVVVVHAQKNPACAPPSDEIVQEEEEDGEPENVRKHRRKQKKRSKAKKHHSNNGAKVPTATNREGERFNSIKIWTNVYGLSIGIYCLVYSLLLPNELSAFVFCVVSLLAGLHEALTPCLQLYLEEKEYEMMLEDRRPAGGSGSKKRRRGFPRQSSLPSSRDWRRQFKRCLGWLCLFQSSVASELTEAAAVSLRKSKNRAKQLLFSSTPKRRHASDDGHCCSCNGSKSSSSVIGSGVMVMPCLILVLGLGLACKVRIVFQ